MIDLFGEDREPPIKTEPSRKFKTMQELYGTLDGVNVRIANIVFVGVGIAKTIINANCGV